MSDQSDSFSSGHEEKSQSRQRSTRWGNGESTSGASSRRDDGGRDRGDGRTPGRSGDSDRGYNGRGERPERGGRHERDFGSRGRGDDRRSFGSDRRDDRGDSRDRGDFRTRDDRRSETGRDGRRGFEGRDGQRGRGDGRGFDGRGEGRDDRRGFEGRGGRDDRRGSDSRGRRDNDFSRRDGGQTRGGTDGQAQRGPRSWDVRGDDRAKRQPEPELPETITGQELDKDVRQQLRTLSKDNADGVAKHLVAVAEFLDEDPERSLLHAQHAVSRAARVPAAREALGLVLYRQGDFAEALREFRTARRLSGSDHLLPYMVDCERGLGRYERALELANSPEAQRLSENDNIELAIVVSGVRRDMGQHRAAVVGLRLPALKRATTQPWAARLFYAYADALMDIDEVAEARQWFVKADKIDRDGETDAAERIDEIDGFDMTDLTPEEDEFVDPRLAEIDLNQPFGSTKPGSTSGGENS